MIKIVNFVLFYFGWFICIAWHNLAACIACLAICLANALIMRYKSKEILIIILIALLGYTNDWIATSLGIFNFSNSQKYYSLQNLWLLSLWLLFITTFNASLNFIKPYKTLTLGLLGCLSGLISYYSGIRFEVFTTDNILFSLIYIGVNWMFLFPLLFRLYHRLL